MRIDIITGFPKIFEGPLTESILQRAQKGGLVEIRIHDLRAYARDKHRMIDDSPFGGGAGMVLKPEPIFECFDTLSNERTYDEVLLTTPQGFPFTQSTANELSMCSNLMIICGHYKGVDHRVTEALVTREISIGDYVLTGGELPAMVIVDAAIRLVPGVIGDAESLLSDSFMEGRLDCRHYTRPASYRGMEVPEELLSGDHKRVEEWRTRNALALTRERRPDLLQATSQKESRGGNPVE